VIAAGQARRIFAWLSAAPALAGLAVWWPMLDPAAPGWPRVIPPPLSLAAALVWVWAATSRARAAGALAALLLAIALARDAGLRRLIRPPEGPTFRIVQWTLDEHSAAERLLAELERELPHVVAIHHPPTTLASVRQLALARRLRLNHAIRRDAILVVSRHPLEPLEPPQIDGIETLFLRVKDPAGDVYVLAMDAATRPLDLAAARALGNFIEARADARPLALACGNARERTDAVWQPVRRAMRAAYEVAGFGWPYSRPTRLPLYARDHIWISEEWIAHSVGYRWSRHASRLRHFAILSRAKSQ
jgi:hypothetical protein